MQIIPVEIPADIYVIFQRPVSLKYKKMKMSDSLYTVQIQMKMNNWVSWIILLDTEKYIKDIDIMYTFE
jgi:hypothetical protein